MKAGTLVTVLFGPPLVLLVVATNLPAARMAFALALCLVLPGLGWARKMHYADLCDTLALACVLSICTTAAVGTIMVLSRSWSLGWGLAALGGIALAGFLPAHLVLDRLGAAQHQARVRRAPTAITTGAASEGWVDWYAEVERREREARAREAAARQAAIEEWIAWYQRAHLLTKRSDPPGN